MLTTIASSDTSFPSSPEVSDTSSYEESSNNQTKVSKHRPSYFTPKIKFSPSEDMMLLHAVQSLGTGDWHIIASRVPGRNARQCRERWNNYVNPALISAPWTAEEDRFLLEKYKELGPRWRTIASYFVSRSTNSIKNRFTILQRRQKKKNRKSKDKKIDGDFENALNIGQQRFSCASSVFVSPADHENNNNNNIDQINQNLLASPNSSVDENSGSSDDFFIFDGSAPQNVDDNKKKQEKDDIFNFLETFKDAEYAFWSNDFDSISFGFSDINFF